MRHDNRRRFLRRVTRTGTAVTLAAAGRPHLSGAAESQSPTVFPDIPRIDVHTHVGDNARVLGYYLNVRDIMKDRYNEDLAFFVNLGDSKSQTTSLDTVASAGKGRFLCTISDYSVHTGMKFKPDELKSYMTRGYVGYKIWCGPWYRRLKPDEAGYRYIDDPAHEPTFAAMERDGILAASTHIADPNGPYGNRTNWCADPVEFWTEILAWRRVLERHPEMTVVAAHGSWLVCQDAQLDFLRNMFATFPKFNVDLAATFQYFHLLDRDNLRDLMTEWSDRIMFGTDISRWDDEAQCSQFAERYHRCFRVLETGETVEGGFFGGPAIHGLALPRNVLENIYFRNAVRIYPRMKEAMAKLGYTV